MAQILENIIEMNFKRLIDDVNTVVTPKIDGTEADFLFIDIIQEIHERILSHAEKIRTK